MKMAWFLTAFVAMLVFSVVFMLFKKTADAGVRGELALLYYFGICTIALLFYLSFKGYSLNVSRNVFIVIFIATVLGVVGNVLLYNSLGSSPNPGYALAIIGANTLVVAVASIFIFKSEFTLVKGLGTILAVMGIILLGLE